MFSIAFGPHLATVTYSVALVCGYPQSGKSFKKVSGDRRLHTLNEQLVAKLSRDEDKFPSRISKRLHNLLSMVTHTELK